MSRSYPVITLWLLENPFDIITLWQLQEGKCSISSPTSTLFWEPRHRFSALPDLPNVYEGSVWGASVISAPRPVRGWELPIKAVDSGESQPGEGQWAYYYQCTGRKITQVQEKSIWFYLKDHRNISLPSVFNITFPFTKETLSIRHIIIC